MASRRVRKRQAKRRRVLGASVEPRRWVEPEAEAVLSAAARFDVVNVTARTCATTFELGRALALVDGFAAGDEWLLFELPGAVGAVGVGDLHVVGVGRRVEVV